MFWDNACMHEQSTGTNSKKTTASISLIYINYLQFHLCTMWSRSSVYIPISSIKCHLLCKKMNLCLTLQYIHKTVSKDFHMHHAFHCWASIFSELKWSLQCLLCRLNHGKCRMFCGNQNDDSHFTIMWKHLCQKETSSEQWSHCGKIHLHFPRVSCVSWFIWTSSWYWELNKDSFNHFLF